VSSGCSWSGGLTPASNASHFAQSPLQIKHQSVRQVFHGHSGRWLAQGAQAVGATADWTQHGSMCWAWSSWAVLCFFLPRKIGTSKKNIPPPPLRSLPMSASLCSRLWSDSTAAIPRSSGSFYTQTALRLRAGLIRKVWLDKYQPSLLDTWSLALAFKCWAC
jgi:hypothetical protein